MVRATMTDTLSPHLLNRTLIRWGIIGCGDVTEVKSGPGFQRARGSSLVAVMRRTADLARDFARRHGVPKWYDHPEALIQDPDVDAIYIATPPASHKPYTLLSAQVGKPVYVEKPMALNFEERGALRPGLLPVPGLQSVAHVDAPRPPPHDDKSLRESRVVRRGSFRLGEPSEAFQGARLCHAADREDLSRRYRRHGCVD